MSAALTQPQLDVALKAFASVGQELGILEKERRLG
jgi:hypothetical protein